MVYVLIASYLENLSIIGMQFHPRCRNSIPQLQWEIFVGCKIHIYHFKIQKSKLLKCFLCEKLLGKLASNGDFNLWNSEIENKHGIGI